MGYERQNFKDGQVLTAECLNCIEDCLCDLESRIPEPGGSSSQSNWNAAEGEPGHVLNRTHWRDVKETVIWEQTVTISEGMFFGSLTGETIPLVVGDTYTVLWGGVSYECVCKTGEYMGYETITVGNMALGGGENTGEPFAISTIVGFGWGIFAVSDGEYHFKIIGNEYTYHVIPPEYLGGSKPYYITLESDENHNTIYETDVTEDEVFNAIRSGYQIVVRRAAPTVNYFDYFTLNLTGNDGSLYFSRIYSATSQYMKFEQLHFHPNDAGGYDIEFHELNAPNATQIPTALKNPYALTFTGAVTGTYDGSAAKTVNIPAAPTKTSQLTNDSGFLTSAPVTSVNGKTGAVTIDIPAVPTAIKNPYSLTINGTAYDGSTAVNMTIEGGTSGGDPIPGYVRAEAERVAKLVQSRQNANTITFLACSDIHYTSPNNANPVSTAQDIHDATMHMGQAMGIIRSLVHIDFAAMFGDMIRDEGEANADEVQAEVRFVNSCLYDAFSGLPSVRLEGNHEDAYSSGVGLSAGQVYANISAWSRGFVHGSRAGNYCYRDFENLKLRVICMNTSEYVGGYLNVSSEQNQWLAEVLDLSEKGDDWNSIILSHHPLDFQTSGGANPILTVKNATGLIGTFHGHIHNFLVDDVSGTNVKRIAIPNAVRDQENNYGTVNGVNYAESTKYRKTAGTAEDTSFCVITIDLAEKKIYADHYGAGYDRVVDYSTPVDDDDDTYTNLVPTSLTADGASVYNGTGYKNGAYVSDGTNYGTDANTVATGYIEYKVGQAIYIKGAELSNNSHVRCYVVSSVGGTTTYAVTSPANGKWKDNSGRELFNIETLGDKYYKITITDTFMTASGGISVGKVMYYRMSLYGSGENLIITHDEPIE